MGLELTFEIEGDKQLIRRLKDVEEDFKDWTPEFVKVGSLLLKTFKENFRTQGSTLGEPWKKLAPSTIAQKKRLGYPLVPLVRTGTMRDSFRSSPSRYEVIIENPMTYFVYHQSRGARTTNLPRRVMMKIDNRRKELISKIFIKAVEDILQRREFTGN